MRNTFSFACCCDCNRVDDNNVLQLQGGGHHDWEQGASQRAGGG